MASADYKGIVDFAQAIDDTYVRKDAPSVPVGGAKGEVLRKKSSTDGDAEWANPLYHFSTLAQMQAALALGQIPDGANVSVEEEQPGGNTGDTSLDTTSENWVQNKVVATAVNTINSDLASLIKITIDQTARSNNDLPSTYPFGLSLTTIGSSTDFPFTYATLITFKANTNFGTQFIANSIGTEAKIRTIANASNWNAWHTIQIT